MLTPRVSDVTGIINKIAPFAHAEEWDNVGLQVGDAAAPVKRIMVALDAGRDPVEAAVSAGCQLLLTHHPLIFTPLKKIVIDDPVGSLIFLAVRHDLAILSLHTNYDIAPGGMNFLLAERLGISSHKPLKAVGREELVKLSVFVPEGHEEQVLESLFRFSGVIGKYNDCSFRTRGIGTFRPLEGARPFTGKIGSREIVSENRIEVLLCKEDINAALNAMKKAHPYEEPAFDLYPLLNKGNRLGLGRIGELPEPTTLAEFAADVKQRLGAMNLRFVGEPGRIVRKVALCGGSGAELLQEAHWQGADLLITGDVKYHEARSAEALGLSLIDAGHFATERPMIREFTGRLDKELRNRGFAAETIPYEGEKEPFSFI